ncbi:hypothetical protein BST61_g11472 [Cercospora zeina]
MADSAAASAAKLSKRSVYHYRDETGFQHGHFVTLLIVDFHQARQGQEVWHTVTSASASTRFYPPPRGQQRPKQQFSRIADVPTNSARSADDGSLWP